MAGLVHLVREQWPVFLAAFGAAGAAAKFFLRDQEVETIRDRTIAAWNALDDIKRACISWLPQKAVARTTLVIIGTVLVQGPQIYLYLDDFKTISQYGWRAWALFVALLSFAIILGLPFFWPMRYVVYGFAQKCIAELNSVDAVLRLSAFPLAVNLLIFSLNKGTNGWGHA
jgi:hypothetical protein